jgi:hypothetical protein
MDLFVLDKLVITVVRKLMNDSALQFATLTVLWLISEVVLPIKKNKKVEK